jgi:insulin receptor substrate 1
MESNFHVKFFPPLQNAKGSILGRERCDSLPTSRNRTNSEHNPQNPIVNTTMPPPRSIPSMTSMRPHSMYSHRYSNSPPVNSYPLSPPSGACSTESDGSSLSIDETDGFMVHSSTPDEGSSFMNMKLMRYFCFFYLNLIS